MEQRLGLGSAPVPAVTNAPKTPTSASDIDRQLQELEARVGGNGTSST